MFGFFRKSDPVLYAPVSGKIIALAKVPDQVFATKVIGDGVAFEPEGSTVCAPCDGVITMIAETGHAFGLTAKNGAEILIHIGLDTVEFAGEGFNVLVKQNASVKKGTPIVELDREFFRTKEACLITPMLVTNYMEHPFETLEDGELVELSKSPVVTFK